MIVTDAGGSDTEKLRTRIFIGCLRDGSEWSIEFDEKGESLQTCNSATARSSGGSRNKRTATTAVVAAGSSSVNNKRNPKQLAVVINGFDNISECKKFCQLWCEHKVDEAVRVTRGPIARAARAYVFGEMFSKYRIFINWNAVINVYPRFWHIITVNEQLIMVAIEPERPEEDESVTPRDLSR